MGQFLTSLNLRGGDASEPELDFDMKTEAFSEEEIHVCNVLVSLQQKGVALVKAINDHKPATEEIRNAIARPTTDNEEKAVEAVLPIVEILYNFYNFSNEFNEGMILFLNALCKSDIKTNLERYKASTVHFANLMDLIFEIDQLKVTKNNLQNDFSYYRRLLQCGRYTPAASPSTSDLHSAIAEEELANSISFFMAPPTPMLKGFIDKVSEHVKEQQLQTKVGEFLTSLWATCFATVNKKETSRPEVAAVCLKIIVISIILYDNIMANGAFCKKSPFNIKNSVKIINSRNSKDKNADKSNLMQALRYNAKHLNDANADKSVSKHVLSS